MPASQWCQLITLRGFLLNSSGVICLSGLQQAGQRHGRLCYNLQLAIFLSHFLRFRSLSSLLFLLSISVSVTRFSKTGLAFALDFFFFFLKKKIKFLFINSVNGRRSYKKLRNTHFPFARFGLSPNCSLFLRQSRWTSVVKSTSSLRIMNDKCWRQLESEFSFALAEKAKRGKWKVSKQGNCS